MWKSCEHLNSKNSKVIKSYGLGKCYKRIIGMQCIHDGNIKNWKLLNHIAYQNVINVLICNVNMMKPCVLKGKKDDTLKWEIM